MSFDPVEGVHYIFNRYAYLGIEIGADKKAIQSAVRTRRAEVHVDRLVNVSDTLVRQAEHMRGLIDQCAEILLNDEVRPLYDERLKDFLASKPKRVSDSGQPIIFLGEEYFSLDSLLGANVDNMTELEALVRQHTQFDEKSFLQLQKLHSRMTDDDEIRSLYRDALTTKYIYLDILEGMAWERLGYIEKKNKISGYLLHADDYGSRVDDEIQRVASEVVDDAIRTRNDALRIGVAALPLLLTDESGKNTSGRVMNDDDIARIKDIARTNIESRADYLKQVAAQKQSVMKELAALAIVQDLAPRDSDLPQATLYLAQPNDAKSVVMKIILDKRTGQTVHEMMKPVPLAELSANPSDRNIIVLTRNAEISEPLVEIVQFGQFLCDEWKNRPAQKRAPISSAPRPK